jgi:hypothetical protein
MSGQERQTMYMRVRFFLGHQASPDRVMLQGVLLHILGYSI